MKLKVNYSQTKKIIFDGARTGNFNFISQKFKYPKPRRIKFSVIKGNENVINEINNYPESIESLVTIQFLILLYKGSSSS